jgi:CubicO group peptidase (beta-lactamase class C family)
MESFFDRFFERAIVEHHVPGAAIVVIKDKDIIFYKGYGYANLEKEIPVNAAETVFRWASVSKLFPIAGVLQLAEKGQIDLNADVNQYLHEWQVPNNFSIPVRVRDLLQHTDGFGTRDIATFSLQIDDLQPLGTLLLKELKSPVQKPGIMITYGSYGTALAGFLVEQITGSRFDDAIAATFFAPLDMRHSTFHQELSLGFQQNLAIVYNYRQTSKTYIPVPYLYINTSPTGGLNSTPLDMAHFVIALLNDGFYGNTRVLTPPSTQAMLEQQFEPYAGFPGVTFGFMEHYYNNQRGLIRDGSGVGIRSQIYLLPKHHLGYIYVQNSRGDEVINELNRAFLDYFFPVSDKAPIANSVNANHNLDGFYRPVQTNEHSLVKLEALLISELHVATNHDGSLTIIPLGEGDVYGGFEAPSQWTEIAPQIFERTDREQYIAFQINGNNNQAQYLLSGSGYHGTYYKLKWYECSRVQFVWMGVCLCIFLSALVTWPFSLLSKSRKRTAMANLMRWVGIITSVLFLTGIIGVLYSLFLKRIAGFPALAFGVSPMAKVMLWFLLGGGILGLVIPFFAIFVWVKNYWSILGRIHYTVVGVAALGFFWWLNYWNLFGFQY